MAYIGRDTDKISNVEVLDNITFDGSSSYTLQKGGSNFTPSSANTLLLSIDGVVQAGNFTVSGSTIDFGVAIAGTSTCDFVLHYGVGLITTPSDGTVTTAKLADSSVTAAKITDATITAAKLASGTVQNQSAFRNIIINGDMSLAQRATSETGITNASGDVFVADRFCWSESGGMTSQFTMSQDTDVPAGYGFAKSLKLDCTTTDTPATTERIRIETRFEGQNLQYLKKGTANAESWTLSFWVKSVKTGTYIVNFRDENNTRIVSKAYTISSASTWEKKTITVAPDTTDPFTNDNAHSLTIAWLLAAGSSLQSGSLADVWQDYANANYAAGQVNFADNTANNFWITGVQLEAGTTASDFEFLPVDVNLRRCQRYYQVLAPDSNQAITQYQANNRSFNQTFMTEMRATPSFTTDTFSNFSAFDGADIDRTHIHAYYNVGYANTSSMNVRGVRLNAEL
ncbi:hypothetical protein N9O38_00965 [Flavobacteriaceae bacterium]|nr:hypothetical protein [Flavobacteriaceae bacterium]